MCKPYPFTTVGCDLSNERNQAQPPILCIFHDGDEFQIFRYVYSEPQPLFMGCFEYPNTNGSFSSTSVLHISDPYRTNEKQFLLSLRLVCEVLYYCFLSSFKHGLAAQLLKNQFEDLSQAVA